MNTRAGELIVRQVIDVLSRKPGILLSLSLYGLACLKTRQCGLYGQNDGRLRDGAVTRGPDPGAHTKNAARLRDGGSQESNDPVRAPPVQAPSLTRNASRVVAVIFYSRHLGHLSQSENVFCPGAAAAREWGPGRHGALYRHSLARLAL